VELTLDVGRFWTLPGREKEIRRGGEGQASLFATGSKYRFRYSDEWTLAEWYVDHATQTYQVFINGEEIPACTLHKGAGKFEGAEIPTAFESLPFGWNNYQPAARASRCRVDDIAPEQKADRAHGWFAQKVVWASLKSTYVNATVSTDRTLSVN